MSKKDKKKATPEGAENSALMAAREKTRVDMLEHLKAEQEARRAAELATKEVEDRLGLQIQKMASDLKQAKQQIKQLTRQIPKPENKPEFTPPPPREFEIENHDIEIMEIKGTDKYPISIFPLDYLAVEEMDKGLSLAEIEEYIKGEHGPGKYSLTAWDTSQGWKAFKGKTQIQIS